jgi:hypothetical protein
LKGQLIPRSIINPGGRRTCKSPTEKRARISPFLDFLGGGGPKQSVSHEDSVTLQNWVIQTIARQMRSVKNPSITSRRDTALIAAICAAPAKGTPRRWPQNCLKITENEVLLWDASIEEPCSLSPCVSGTPGESGWPGRTNGGSTANLSNGANHNSFSPGPTALPWAEQPCTGVLGTSERKVRLSHRQRLLRRCTSYSWSTIGLRNGRSSPRATVSGIANEYRPNMLMWSWISGESLATSAS